MKIRITTLSLTILCLALSVPAFAGQIYNDGPTNGTYSLLTIDGTLSGQFNQSISDGFVAASSGTGTEVFFAEWVLSGEVPTGVTWAIGTENFGGTLTAGANFGTTLLCTNGSPFNGGLCAGSHGYDVYESHFTISDSFTAGDTYWLTLTNATDNQSEGINGWDLNNGPATCDVETGAIVPGGGGACGVGGESFTITSGAPSTPEPSSIMLLGSGILGLAGVLRRKLTR